VHQGYKLYKIDIDNGNYINTHYEYGTDSEDALQICLEKYHLLKTNIKEVHEADKAELLDASRRER